MAEHIVPPALVWLLLLWLISQLVVATAPTALALWREQTTQVEARLRLLAEMPLLPEPVVWDLLRPASGKHRKRPLRTWVRKAVAA
jgi:hypothetical protein